jgi:uncharacterized protein (DUF2236 family)
MSIVTREQSADVPEEIEPQWALGPGAVSWRVLRNPCVFVIALLREGILLTLHPQFAAAAVDHDRVHQDPVTRSTSWH